MKKNQLKILFIGNSHTYFNDMPIRVKRRFDEEGYNCSVTMLAHPGWFLAQHVENPVDAVGGDLLHSRADKGQIDFQLLHASTP